MAKERGWWTFSSTVPLDDSDLEHIAIMIKEGYNQGEVCACNDDDDDNEEYGQ